MEYERRRDEGRGNKTFRNGTRAASPQHNKWILAHYLLFVYYYLWVLVSKLVRGVARTEKSRTPHIKSTYEVPEFTSRLTLGPPAPAEVISVFRKLEGGDLEDEVSELNVATRKSHRV